MMAVRIAVGIARVVVIGLIIIIGEEQGIAHSEGASALRIAALRREAL